MPPPRPMDEPQSLVAGDTLQFDKSVDNFPASDGWALKYVLTNALLGLTPINIPSQSPGGEITSTGPTFNINVPASTTAGWAPGKYQFIIWVAGSGSYAGQRFKVGEGWIQVFPNPATATSSTDYRSQAKQNLDAIDAVLQNKITADVQSYKINGRELVKMRHTDLLQLRAYYFQQWKAERIAAGEQFPSSQVGAFFGRVRT